MPLQEPYFEKYYPLNKKEPAEGLHFFIFIHLFFFSFLVSTILNLNLLLPFRGCDV